MKVKKGSLSLFFAAAVISALVISLPVFLIITEANTSALGFERFLQTFAIDFAGEKCVMTVNDKQFMVALSPIYDFLRSKFMFFISTVWFFL